MYHIKEFAAMTGLPPSKIRFYEKHGLLEMRRDENGYRVFSPDDAFRSNAFRVLMQYGFSVREAARMMDAEQGTDEFRRSLDERRMTLQREADLLRYRLEKLDSALDLIGGDPAPFMTVNAPGQLFVRASYGRDFSVAVENEREIAFFYELLSVTSCARIITKADLEDGGDTVDPSYVISMPEHESYRLLGQDLPGVEHLSLGRCVRFRRRTTRAESVRKETFTDLFAYLDERGLEIRGDIILFPTFLNLDDEGNDIETLLVPV